MDNITKIWFCSLSLIKASFCILMLYPHFIILNLNKFVELKSSFFLWVEWNSIAKFPFLAYNVAFGLSFFQAFTFCFCRLFFWLCGAARWTFLLNILYGPSNNNAKFSKIILKISKNSQKLSKSFREYPRILKKAEMK